MIRRAKITDVPAMGRIINDAAEFGLMLPKSTAALYENVRQFHVVEDDDAESPTHGEVVGVCGLSIIWANLAEIVSLAVSPSQRGKGLGKRLVEVCLEEAKQLGIKRVMSLTYEQKFFERLGFEVVDRQNLPLKVWADCVRCPKHDACDEIAMIRVFDDVPEPEGAPATPSTAQGARFEVPVVITTTAAGKDGKPLIGD
ncbi:MAG: N-acetyltransferase [Planctomycetota bacterium]